MLATTATLSQETATAKGSDAGGGGALEVGGGIGKFSKRRTNAPPTKTYTTAPPPDTMAEDGAGTKSDVISRGFDVDLMSKNAEDDTNNGSGGKDDEVPLTIRTSDDDVDDIVDGLIKIAESNEKHDDAWELGTGCNYSLNELADMFEYPNRKHVDDVKGNYRKTLRLNNDAVERLGWQPTDKLKSYINEIKLRNNGL